MALHLRGVVLPGGEERDLYVAGGLITLEPVAGAATVVDRGWLVPGLVDVHTHPGAERPGDPLDEELLREHGVQHRDSGVTLLRVPGSAARLPPWFGQDAALPRVQGAGPWLAAPGRFFPGWGGRSSWRRCRRWRWRRPRRRVAGASSSPTGRSGPARTAATSRRCRPRSSPRSSGGSTRPAGAWRCTASTATVAPPPSRPAPTPSSTARTWRPTCWTPWHGRERRWCRPCSPSRAPRSGSPATLHRSRSGPGP